MTVMIKFAFKMRKFLVIIPRLLQLNIYILCDSSTVIAMYVESENILFSSINGHSIHTCSQLRILDFMQS